MDGVKRGAKLRAKKKRTPSVAWFLARSRTEKFWNPPPQRVQAVAALGKLVDGEGKALQAFHETWSDVVYLRSWTRRATGGVFVRHSKQLSRENLDAICAWWMKRRKSP